MDVKAKLKKITRSVKGSLSPGKLAAGIIGVVIVLAMLPSLLAELVTAGDALNTSGYPLASFFADGGIIYLIIMAAVLIGALAIFGFKMKK